MTGLNDTPTGINRQRLRLGYLVAAGELEAGLFHHLRVIGSTSE